VIIAGATIGTCCSMPTLSMLNDGYQVFPVVDACAAWNEYEAQAAIARMTGAGAEPVSVFALDNEAVLGKLVGEGADPPEAHTRVVAGLTS